MNFRDALKAATAVQKVLKTAPRDLRHFGDAAHGAADLIETGQALVGQLAANPLASAMGIAQAFGGTPKPASPQRPPPQRAPATPAFREERAPRRQAPIKVAPAEVVVATIDDDVLDATVIDPSKPAPKRR